MKTKAETSGLMVRCFTSKPPINVNRFKSRNRFFAVFFRRMNIETKDRCVIGVY